MKMSKSCPAYCERGYVALIPDPSEDPKRISLKPGSYKSLFSSISSQIKSGVLLSRSSRGSVMTCRCCGRVLAGCGKHDTPKRKPKTPTPRDPKPQPRHSFNHSARTIIITAVVIVEKVYFFKLCWYDLTISSQYHPVAPA